MELNFEHTEGESIPVEGNSQENYLMPEAITVNGEQYDAQLLSTFSESFTAVYSEKENLQLSQEDQNDASAIAVEVGMTASEINRSPLARTASIADALAAADLEQAIQAQEAQEIVADTEGEKGLLETLSEKKKHLMGALALALGLGAAMPASAAGGWYDNLPRGTQQQKRGGFDIGPLIQAGVKIGVDSVAREARNDIGKNEQQARRELEQHAQEERLQAEARLQFEQMKMRHEQETQNFTNRREYELESKRLRNEKLQEIQRHEKETQMLLKQMELRHGTEWEKLESNFRRRVQEVRTRSEHRGKEIEIARQRESGNIVIDARTRGIEEAVKRIFK